MNIIADRLLNLTTGKFSVMLILVSGMVYMEIIGKLPSETYKTILIMVISYYFLSEDTQKTKENIFLKKENKIQKDVLDTPIPDIESQPVIEKIESLVKDAKKEIEDLKK